ncbi:MAG: FAD-linked oxidase [Ramlibacter sp.]|nr:FAD-linked oxidase [Ramlibacter sp.]
MKLQDPMKTVKALVGENVRKSERCCGESGTFGVTRKILTSCPSCLQGLTRYNHDLQNGLLEADYIVIEMARKILGEDWLKQYVRAANDGGIERVLV